MLTAGGIGFKQSTLYGQYQKISLDNSYCSFITTRALSSDYRGINLQLDIDRYCENKKILDTNRGHVVNNLGDILYYGENLASISSKQITDLHEREIKRRKKIGLANKGKVPWNKGRTHTEETRKRISKRTIEAMSDPKIRKKMSEAPRSHSIQSKARISLALKRVWNERLQQKRSQENCYRIWANCTAEAARKGFLGEEEFKWDSYNRIKSEIISREMQQKADKARAKEVARLIKEKAKKDREEMAERRAILKKEKDARAKIREMKALERKRFEDMKMKLALSKGLKVKGRSPKSSKRKMENSAVQRDTETVSHPNADNLDIDIIKMEKTRRGISLADQIQAVKERNKEFSSANISRSLN